MQALYAAGLALQVAEHVPGTADAETAIADARHHIQDVVDELRGLLRALRAGEVAAGLLAVSRAVGSPVVTEIDTEATAGMEQSASVELVVAASSAVAAARRCSSQPLSLRLVREHDEGVLELAGPGGSGGGGPPPPPRPPPPRPAPPPGPPPGRPPPPPH